MQPPKHATVKVSLYPVAVDIIAEYGDLLMVHDGVVIGVYRPEQKPELTAPPPKLITNEPTKKPRQTAPKPRSRKNNTVPRLYHTITYDLVVEQLSTFADHPELPTFHTHISKYVNMPDLPQHVIRDRLNYLIGRKRVERFPAKSARTGHNTWHYRVLPVQLKENPPA
jgi:hypothetical protein